MRVFVCLFAVFCLLGGAFGSSLPPFITPCSLSDPKLNQCVTDIIRVAAPIFAKGLPELGIMSLDPAKLGRIEAVNPALKIVFTDSVVNGLGDSRINAFKISPTKGKGFLDFTANITMKANYNMDGQILILPIRGDGAAKIKIMNLNIMVKYDFETQTDETGVGHWIITGFKNTYKSDRAQFRFTNLFGGKNKQLADTTEAFMNSNWQIIMSEIAPPVVEQIIEASVDVVKKFFMAIPVDEIILP